jgi:hypothetical protein
MCGKGSNTQTTTSAPNPQAMAAYSDLLGRASGVANLPFQQYGGEFVAPMNAQQQQAGQNINQYAGFALPFINQAAGYANQAAQPITAANINQYQSPYIQDVVNATEAQFNNQNQQQLNMVRGNAAAQGALGGDREAIAEGVTAGQQQAAQAPVIAGLYNQGYNTALNTALAEQQNLGQSAYSLGNLGVAGQNAALTGANAQLGYGTLGQSTQQALDTALYNQFLAQQGYPFQTTQWLAGIDTGVGSQMGGTSSTTGPAPNQTANYLGLGLLGLGLLNRGGGVGRDSGGRIRGFALGGMPYSGGSSYIPTIQLTPGQGAPKPPGLGGQSQQAPDPLKQASSIMDMEKKIQGLGGGGLWGKASDALGFGDPGLDEVTQAGAEAGLSPDELGLGAGGEESLGLFGGWRHGGRIAGFAAGGYADGGGEDSFEDRFSPSYGLDERLERSLGLGDVTGTYPVPNQDVPLPRSRPSADLSGLSVDGGDYVNPTRVNGQPQNLTGPIIPPGGFGGGPAEPLPLAQDVADRRVAGLGQSPMSFAPSPDIAPSRSEAPGETEQKQSGFGFNPFGLSHNVRRALLAAGFGMMASRSPFLGNAIGEGGLAGLSAYSGAQKEIREEKKEAFNEQKAMQQLQQHAKDAENTLKFRTQQLQNQEENLKLRREQIEQGKVPAGYERVEGGLRALPGGPADPEQARKIAEAKRRGEITPLPEEAWNAHGDDFLKYLPRDNWGIVQGLASYDIDPKTLPVVGGEREKYLNWAKQYDPSYDQRFYNQSNAAFNRFSTGKQGDTVRSLGVAVEHLDTLGQLADALQNGDVRKLNQLNNWITTELGKPAVTNFNTAKQIVADEVLKAVVGSGAGSQFDREQLQHQFSAANSPAQLKGAIETAEKLMAGQLHGLRYQYEHGTRKKDFDEMLTPRARERLGALEKAAAAGVAPAGDGAPTAAGRSAIDQQALDWANANPNDPRAAQIKQRLGVQ